MASSVLSRIQIIMEANTANYNNELRRAQQNSGKNFKKIKAAAKGMALGVGASLVAMGAKSLQTAGQFESAMNGVRAVSGATGEDFTKLRDIAKELGSSTAYSATEAANGMEYLAMAGMSTEQVLSTIPNALNLAAAGGIELAQSADILSNILTGMGLAAEDSGRAADVLAATAAGANVDIGMLGESMKFAAPIAKQLGLSLEETAATIGVMGNAGIQGSEAGTALRAVYTRLATDTKAKAHFERLGIEIADSTGKMKGMVEIFADLEEASKNMTAQEKLALYKESVGAEAMSAFGVTIDSITDGSLTNLINKLENSEGAAKKMADTRMEGLEGSFKSLASAWEGFQIELADGAGLNIAATAVNAVANGLRGLTAILPEIITKLQSFEEKIGLVDKLKAAFGGLVFMAGNLASVFKRTAEIIAPVIGFFIKHAELSKSLAIAIGLVSGAIVAYNAAIVIAATVTTAFGAALALVTSPVTLTIAGITALVTAGVLLYRNWDEVKAKATAIWGSITSYIGGKIDAIKGYFSTNFPAMTAIVSGALQNIKSVIMTGFALIKNTVTTVLNVIKAVISGDFKAIPNIIGNGLKNAASIVTKMMGNILNIIKNTGVKLFQIGKDLVQGLINGIKSGASGVVTAIGSMASNAVTKAKSVLNIRSPSRVMKKVGEQTAEGMAAGIKKGTKQVVTEAQRMAEQAIKAVEDGIDGFRKRIALFGDNSELSSLLYDINSGKYAGASDARIAQLVKEATALHQLETQLTATNAVQKRFASWQDQREKLRNTATSLIRGRFEQFGQDKDSASNSLQGMLGGLEQQTPMGKIQAEYEARNAIIEQYEQTHTNMVEAANAARIASDQAYMSAKRDLFLMQGEALFGDMAGLAKSFVGEQSGIYRTLFAIEKSFAIAQSAMAIQQSVAKALSIGFPANIPAIAAAVMQGAKLVSNIKSITMPVGQAHDGIANVPREGTWVLDKNERVVKADDNKKLSRFLDNSDGTTGNINVNVSVTMDGKSSVQSDSQYGKQIGQGLAAAVTTQVQKMMRPNGMLDRQYQRR